MKDFLKDVPKLEDLPKALVDGVEHYLIRNDDGFDILPVEDTSSAWEFVRSHRLSPIPELTHWEASDFHKWFAENGMYGAQVENKSGYHNITAIRADLSFVTYSNTIISFADAISIRKDIHTEPTPCTKPIKTGM